MKLEAKTRLTAYSIEEKLERLKARRQGTDVEQVVELQKKARNLNNQLQQAMQKLDTKSG